MTPFSVVVPTLGRPSLQALLAGLAGARGPRPAEVVLVDDRPGGDVASLDDAPSGPALTVTVLRSGGRGPAAARNLGWLACTTPWVVFLDDDVLVGPDWLDDLAADLAAADPATGAIQGRIHVPLPGDRRPTDWERGTAGLATSAWITADIAYRRAALVQAGGFDERFPRAFREDADLALRVQDCGWELRTGRRATTHPVRPAPWNASVRQQRGNADDVLMSRLHGRDWHRRAAAPRGRRRRHLAITAGLTAAAAGVLTRRPRLAALGAAVWGGGTAEFAAARIAPGPRDARELARMAATSALIPPAASWHWLRGLREHRHAGRIPAAVEPPVTPVDAVLFDRDGTLVHDVPYNGRPDLVRPVAGAREALDRLRAAGVAVGVVSNQSGVARGLLTEQDVQAVNARVEELLGPFSVWRYCPHGEGDGCRCRKPAPGMVLDAVAALGVAPRRCWLVGDTVADVDAGTAAGVVASVLVPNAATRVAEVQAARHRLADLGAVAEAVLAGAPARVGP